MNPLRAYLESWHRQDIDGACEVLDDGCVVVDSHGTVLRGPAAVAEWMSAWVSAGGVVHDLAVTEETEGDGVVTAQWVLQVTWQGVEATVEGRSVAHVREDRITYLRDYATTGPLGDWDGTWQR
ncbi:nuclear transport factor 2 family protein [Actinotalea lenta]|uniref:nuclear transport factor 2 family protein n=1 Tax=Actinotalea lenta TaxID=3064654 RepID=UPI002729D2C7|nr:nuclear transport factor 2 family protein [Isoptericola sp. b490]